MNRAENTGEDAMSRRLLSLDVLRGLDMFWILMPTYPVFHALLVALGLKGCWLDLQMDHPAWVGFTFYDMIFPLFLFLAGVSWPYSYAGSVKRGLTPVAITLRVVRRVAVLYALGALITVLYAKPGWENFRHQSVLGWIGISWGVATALYRTLGARARLAVVAASFAAYWAVFGPGLSNQETCLPVWLDRHVFAPWLHATGLVELVCMVGTATFGMAAGDLLRADDARLPRAQKAVRLAAAGLALILVGLVGAFGLGPFSLPLIKNAWTPTFALVSGGGSCLALALVYWAVDVRGWCGWTRPFEILGANSLAAYVLSRTVLCFDALKPFLFGRLAALCPTPAWGEFLAQCCYLAAYWGLLAWMYRLKIFFKA